LDVADHLFHQLGCRVVANTFVVDGRGGNSGMMGKPVYGLCDKTPKEAILELNAGLNHALLEANYSVNGDVLHPRPLLLRLVDEVAGYLGT